MKKLHFRRFFRQTTTTRGGSTAGPPPEHHHRRRRLPCTSCTQVWHSSPFHKSTHPQIPPLHLSFTFLFSPLTIVYSLHQETLGDPWRLRRPTRPGTHSVTHVQEKNPRRSIQFSLGQACKNTQRRAIRPDTHNRRPDAGASARFCSSIFTTFHNPSHFHPFTKYLPHIPNTSAIHFPPPFHRSTFTITCHPLRHQELGSLEIS